MLHFSQTNVIDKQSPELTGDFTSLHPTNIPSGTSVLGDCVTEQVNSRKVSGSMLVPCQIQGKIMSGETLLFISISMHRIRREGRRKKGETDKGGTYQLSSLWTEVCYTWVYGICIYESPMSK